MTDPQAAAPPAFHVNVLSTPAHDRWWITARGFDRRRRPTDSDEERDERDAEPNAFQVMDRLSGQDPRVVATGFCVMLPAVSADGRLLACLGYDRQITVWDASTGAVVQSVPLDEPAAASSDPNATRFTSRGWLTFSADGRLLLCAIDGAIALWEMASGKRLVSPAGAFTFDVPNDGEPSTKTPRFTPEGGHILAVSAKRFVGVWRVGEPQPTSKWSLPPSAEFGLAPDGSAVWWFTRNGLLRHWSVRARVDGERADDRVTEPFGRPRMFSVVTPAVRLSADGGFALGTDKEGRWRVWQMPRRVPIVDRIAPDLRSIAIGLTAQPKPGAALRGLLACGGSRLEVFDLPSMNLVAAFDGDGTFEGCEFESDVILSASSAGQRHRFRLRRV